jgi:hypothetical protein
MMQLRQRGWWASGLCAVVALALAGCGGEDGAGGVQGAPSEAAPTPTPGLAGVSGDEAPLDESSVASAISAATGVPASGIQVVRLERVTWPDGCLGLASQGQVCSQALVDGWLAIVLMPDGAERRYRGGAGRVLAEAP